MAEIILPKRASFRDFTGVELGDIAVASWAGMMTFTKGTVRHSFWNCVCKCGKEFLAPGYELHRGKPKSCGCMTPAIIAKARTTHGMYGTPEWTAWQQIRNRCLDPNNEAYPQYGGRGITVFVEWVESFEVFFAAVGSRPSDKHSIDRFPNNNGNYEPGNVRWATSVQQNRNRRDNLLVEYNGQTKCLKQWCEELRLPYRLILERLRRSKWSVEKSFTFPLCVRCDNSSTMPQA